MRGDVSENESSVVVIDTADGRVLQTLKSPTAAGELGLGNASALAVSEDGGHVAAGYWFGKVVVWQTDTGQIVAQTNEIESAIFTIQFAKDGNSLLFGTRDADVYAWDWKLGHSDMKTFDLERDLSGYIVATSVAWSHDGKTVVAGVGRRAISSSDTGADTSIRVWDAANSKLLIKLEGHTGGVATVTFSPDDRWIVSGSYDGTIRYWDRQTGKQVITIAATDGGRWLAITDRGFFAGSPGSEDLISVVRGFESYSVAQFRKHLYRPDLVEQLLKGDPTRLYADAVHGLDLAKILESGSAPQIEPLPGRKAEQANDTVRVTLRITDTGGGIGKGVDWRVNGVTSGGDEAPPAASAEELASGFRIVSQTLRVDPTQKNEIEVTAYNGEGLLASAPYRLVVDPFGVTSAPRARMFILSVGVSNYDNKDWSLKYAARDAADFASSMEAVAKGGPYEQVRLTVIPEAEATRGGIDAAFKKIKDDVRPTDVFILFVAGHGRTVQSTGTYYFLPRDLTFEGGKSVEDGIGQDQWQTWLKQIAAQKSILIFDTCESSAAAGLTRGEKERETAVDRLRDATGRSVITAARQAAYEGYKEHGVLTYAILDALSEIAGQPSTEVDLYQLAAHVDREVPSISKSLFGVAQRPHNKIEGNFPLGMRKAGLIATQGSSATSTVPTHVMVRAERVRARPAADTQGDRELAPGTQVYVLKYSGDWAAVGRDGQPLGYVPADALVRLQ